MMTGIGIAVTVFFSTLTVFFSFLAYLHTKERFRLELSKERWEIYEAVLKYCSTVTAYGRIPEHQEGKEEQNKNIIDALIAASESFRGIGYHKTKALFGDDINEIFKGLNSAYATLVSKGDATKEFEALKFTYEFIEKLPDMFKPYLYFGDYKNDYIVALSVTKWVKTKI